MSRKLFISSIISVSLMATVPFAAQAQPEVQAPEATAVDSRAVSEGEIISTADGQRLGRVYKTFADGGAAVIVRHKMVVIPAQTLSRTEGKLTTSLSYREAMKRD
jgi:hypothetical protein